MVHRWLAVVGLICVLGTAGYAQYAPYSQRLQQESLNRLQRQTDHYLDQAYQPNFRSSVSDAPLRSWMDQLRQQEEAERARKEAAAERAAWLREQERLEAARALQAELEKWHDAKRRGQAGDADAAFAVARTLLRGDSRLPKDEVTGSAGAIPWLRLASRNGSAGAAWKLGRLLEESSGTTAASKEATEAYCRAVELGAHDAVSKAVALLLPDRAAALQICQPGIKAGRHRSMREGAILLLTGPKPSAEEIARAVGWLETASADDMTAAAYLAVMYYDALGVKEDHGRAVALAQKVLASGAKCPQVYEILGRATVVGAGGLERSVVQALDYMQKAADMGSAAALQEVAFWYRTGWGNVPRLREEELKWRDRLVQRGSVRDAALIGKDYSTGEGQDWTIAAKYYRIASDAGDNESAYRLAKLLAAGGNGLAADPPAARSRARRAAERGYAPAEALYGVFCAEGVGGAVDHAEAAGWLAKAAGKHIADAQRRYGWMLINGQGVTKDERAGVGFLKRAASSMNPEAMLAMGQIIRDGRYGEAVNPQLAREYLEEAAKTKDAPAVATAAKAELEKQDKPGSIYESLRIQRP